MQRGNDERANLPGGNFTTGTQIAVPAPDLTPTSRAVDAESITPPGAATDSIRCAIPTCSPTAV